MSTHTNSLKKKIHAKQEKKLSCLLFVCRDYCKDSLSWLVTFSFLLVSADIILAWPRTQQ